MLVKICGITNLEDALCAAEAGADAIGFVFAKSPRQVSPAQVAEITRRLPAHLTTVGLFVDAPLQVILQGVKVSGVKAVQLHGNEQPELLEEVADRLLRQFLPPRWGRTKVGGTTPPPYPSPISPRRICLRHDKGEGTFSIPTDEATESMVVTWPTLTKAFRPRAEKDLQKLKEYAAAEAFLIDAHVEGIAGGTGRCADWALAAEAKRFGRVILAGGLNPENVAQAIALVAPFGVDVSSGVESAPGKKDPAKVREFIQRAREASSNHQVTKTPRMQK